jgi:hypothetical protein
LATEVRRQLPGEPGQSCCCSVLSTTRAAEEASRKTR